MAGLNQMGPFNEGPMTGRGLGRCTNSAGNYADYFAGRRGGGLRRGNRAFAGRGGGFGRGFNGYGYGMNRGQVNTENIPPFNKDEYINNLKNERDWLDNEIKRAENYESTVNQDVDKTE